MDSRPPHPRTLEMARARLDQALSGRPYDVGLLMLRARADERTGRYAEAAGFFERAAHLARDTGDAKKEGAALLDCGLALSRAGFDDEAVEALERAQRLFETLGDRAARTAARMGLARHQWAHRRREAAVAELEACLPWLDGDDLGWALDRLLEIRRRDGDLDAALELARAGVRAAARAQDSRAFGLRLAALGRLHLEAGHLAKAQHYLTKALPYLREGPGGRRLLEALLALADLADVRGQPTAAAGHLEEALRTVDRGGPIRKQGLVRWRLAEKVEAADPVRAQELLVQAIGLLREAGDPEASAPAWLKLADVQERLGETAEAEASRAKAADYYAMVGHPAGPRRAARLR